MRKNLGWAIALATGTALALAGCTSAGSSSGAATQAPASPPAASAPAAASLPGYGTQGGGAAGSSAALTTATTSLGRIVVDGSKRTVYVFDQDTPNSGRSSCSGACLSTWPAVLTTSGSPTVAGVTGTVGTIPAASGGKQVTLDGRPLYTYAGDRKPGDVTGQGIGGIWWVVSPSGAKITAMH